MGAAENRRRIALIHCVPSQMWPTEKRYREGKNVGVKPKRRTYQKGVR